MNTDHKPAPVLPLSSPEAGETEPGLQDYVATVFESRWLILGIVALALAGGLGYALVAPPIFSSDASVQVEEKGDSKGVAGVQELTDMFSVKAAADTEIEILRSRSLLGSVVEKLRLDIIAAPAAFPLLGRAWARRHDKGEPQPPVMGLSRYAWGGERLQVTRLQVPRDLLGEKLWLVALQGGRYEVRDADGDLLAKGAVDHAATGLSGQFGLYVSELRARPGTRFRLVKLTAVEAIERLQKDLVIAEKGKKTGVIRLELSGADPERISEILDSIGDSYVRQNVERKSAEAEKTLEFISAQTPEQKLKLEEAEKALNGYQSQHGSIDVSLETSALIDRAAEVERAISELEIQKAELRQRFTDNHYFVTGLNDKTAKLEAQRSALEGRIKKLPDTELQSVRLMRDVRVANQLYVLLLNKAQELRVVKSGTIGNVRVLDRSVVPRKPVRPDLSQVVPLSLALGLFLGITAAFVRQSLSRGVEDPDELEPLTGIGVYATIPHSRAQGDISRAMAKHKTTDRGVLATSHPEDLAVESVRSLRTSLQFALMDASNNVIALAGPSPSIGKSFVCLNLAQVLADSGKRVLVIDGDIRKGKLHHHYGMSERSPGLSEVIAGSAPLDGCLRSVGPNLDLLTTGAFPPNPSELLQSARFTALVEQVSKQYDLVVIDTPPCLAVTDASIIGRLAGVTLLVLRAGQHPHREILQALKRLGQAGVRPQGLVFNDVVHLQRKYGYGYAYAYQYAYKRDKKAS